MEIVQQYSANDRQELLNKWYREFYPMVYKLVVDKTKDTSIVTDIFHDSLIVIYEKLVRNELKLTSKISTYLYSIVSNKCMEHIRKANKENKVAFTDELDEVEESVYDVAKDVLLKQLALCLEKLSDSRRKVLTAFYFHKLRTNSIAEIYDLKNSENVKTQKYKAIIDLKNCFKKHKAA